MTILSRQEIVPFKEVKLIKKKCADLCQLLEGILLARFNRLSSNDVTKELPIGVACAKGKHGRLCPL